VDRNHLNNSSNLQQNIKFKLSIFLYTPNRFI